MKPSDKQKAIIQTCLDQFQYWLVTNDIDSPTHSLDQWEDIHSLIQDQTLSPEDGSLIDEHLDFILDIIRKNK